MSSKFHYLPLKVFLLLIAEPVVGVISEVMVSISDYRAVTSWGSVDVFICMPLFNMLSCDCFRKSDCG